MRKERNGLQEEMDKEEKDMISTVISGAESTSPERRELESGCSTYELRSMYEQGHL